MGEAIRYEIVDRNGHKHGIVATSLERVFMKKVEEKFGIITSIVYSFRVNDEKRIG